MKIQIEISAGEKYCRNRDNPDKSVMCKGTSAIPTDVGYGSIGTGCRIFNIDERPFDEKGRYLRCQQCLDAEVKGESDE